MFTTHQRATLRAAMDRIVPEDEFPSASQAGGMNFIDQLFATDLAQRVPDLQRLLDRIETTAITSHTGQSFEVLNTEQQDALLSSFTESPDRDMRSLFNWFVDLVTESFYADPANGGNANAVSWKMIGYEPRVPGYDGGVTSAQAITPQTTTKVNAR